MDTAMIRVDNLSFVAVFKAKDVEDGQREGGPTI